MEDNLNELPEEELTPLPTLSDEMPEFPDEFGNELDTFLDDVDPATVVTIRPGSGSPAYQTVTEPTSLSVLLQRAGLTWNGQLDAFVEGAPINLDTPVSGGVTVTLIGNVKGGIA